MQKVILGVAAAAGVALAATGSAQPVASESFSGSVVGTQNTTGNNPGTIPGTPDIDPAGTYNSTYAYSAVLIQSVENDATDYPAAADNKYLTFNGSTDHFLRIFATADIPSSTPNINFAFAFRLDSVSATASENDIDLWRILDQAGTGGGANLAAVTIRDGVLTGSNSGTVNGVTPSPIANVTDLTVGTWYVVVGSYARSTTGTGTWNATLINESTKAVVGTPVSLTGLTASNMNGVRVLSTGATFAAPSGTAALAVSLDTIAFYNGSLNHADTVTAARTTFGLTPASVNDWTQY